MRKRLDTKTRRCPHCGSNNVYVKNSRYRKEGVHYRRRECADCLTSFSTLEIPQTEYNRFLQKEKELEALKKTITRLMVAVKIEVE